MHNKLLKRPDNLTSRLAYFCFVDYTKAFDKVKWDGLRQILEEMGTPHYLIKLN